ncbi:SOS response-associated peptidase family protein [Pelagerythrobacter aerophilus]|uniref:Abasic site processing protein n=1 Tax=Pelagerythrobacter aerophilus TaxID=2306995 RepID=A0A418NLI2_9SPHN|nr:SOS response-associated peptidase [Pelagerythrobacter aerophilus]RIV80409.1 SOS response-associated peptidase [Pelagerythrobacter aerophilus]
MCNNYRLEVDLASIADYLGELDVAVAVPEGMPNVPAREDIRIGDTAPIVRSVEGARGAGELVNRRWSWPGAGGKPVYNFRSEGREFTSHRCLILADGFYEFTAPVEPGQKRKTKWLFTLRDHPWFCIAGIWRSSADGEAFTMLTTAPGEDIAPYHRRQIIPLPRERWIDWLDTRVPAREVLQVLPKGSLPATRVYPPPSAQGSLL